MRNAKRFLAVLLASTMSIQSLTPAAAEMIVDNTADGDMFAADAQDEVYEDEGIVDDTYTEETLVTDEEPLVSDEELVSDDEVSLSDAVEDGIIEDEVTDDAQVDDAFDLIDTVDGDSENEAAPETETEEETSFGTADGVLEDEDLALEEAAVDEFEQASVVIDANSFAPFKGRTKAQVEQKYITVLNDSTAAGYKDSDSTTWYTTQASTKAPYNEGVLASSTISSMNAMTDYYRWLTGMGQLTGKITTNTPSMQYQALDRNFYFNHDIPQSAKPADMPQSLWDKGFAVQHNILARFSTPRGSIKNWISEGFDLGTGTWEDNKCGHRHALIGANVSGVAFGYSGVVGIGKSYYTNPSGVQGTFAAFPAAGYMPNDLLIASKSAWTVYLNTTKVKMGAASGIKVRVTDTSTGSSYICTTANKMLLLQDGNKINFKQPTPAGGKDTRYTGSYKVEVIGLTNTAGNTVKLQYTVNFIVVATPKEPKSVSTLNVRIPTQVYTGSALTPEVTVTDGLKTLVKGTDFTVSYRNNINIGTANVTITGIGDYTGTLEKTFVIAGRNLPMNSSLGRLTYTGSELKPEIRMYDSSTGKYLVNGVDFTVVYRNNTNVGNASATITGKGMYQGVRTSYFDIVAKSLPAPTAIADQTYTGSAIKPAVTVYDSARKVNLTAGTDYTVAYSSNTNVGTATVTVTGKGNYTGTRKVTFNIKAATSAIPAISAIAAQTYTGSALTPAVQIYDSSKSKYLMKDTDYTVSYSNNTNAGTATVTVTGKGSYSGTKTATFAINPKALPAPNTIADQKYTGSAIKPAVTVYDSARKVNLTSGTDYTVSYTSNTNVGTATVTVTGKGNYSGTKTVTFKITSSTLPMMSAVSDQTYTGSALTPAVQIYDSSKSKYLVKGTDYTLTYTNNVNAGTATVTAKGIGAYTGSVSQTFTINPKQYSKANISATTFTYTGSEIKPEITVTDTDRGVTLGSADYEVKYSKNVNAGEGTVSVTGRGNYTGWTLFIITIKPKKIGPGWSAGFTGATYSGSAYQPKITVTDPDLGNVLTEGTDYTVTYGENTEAGSASYSIYGTGNYTGSVAGLSYIAPKSLPTPAAIATQTYTGSAITPAVTVYDSARKVNLKEGTDYTVSYRNNIQEGTASVVVTGKGNYTGSKTVTFKIAKANYSVTFHGGTYGKIYNRKTNNNDLTQVTVQATAGQTVTAPKAGEEIITSDFRYYLEGWYTDPKFTEASRKIGYTFDENGIRHFRTGYESFKATGDTELYAKWVKSKEVTFMIDNSVYPASAADIFDLSAEDPECMILQVFSDDYQEVKIYVPEGAKCPIPYVNTKEERYTFDGWYYGTKKVSEKFRPTGDITLYAKLETADWFIDPIPDQAYTGRPVTPKLVIDEKGKLLKLNTDYTVTYKNNVNPGFGVATVEGLGRYEGLTGTAYFLIGYKDVQDSSQYYFKPVYWASVNGIAGGFKEDNTFRPQDACTRAQMVTFLWRMAGKPEPKSLRNPFTDLDSSAYYYKAVLWAVEKGITKGYSEDNTFRPDIACQREHAVMFLWRFAGMPAPRTTVNMFTDISKKDYFYYAALWASEKGIARGYTQADGSFKYRPGDDCMREHIVTFLYRY